MFWIELSYRYGMLVDDLQERISSEHFVELMAAEVLNPQGEQRADLRNGILASVVANSAPFRSKESKTFEPKDFMPNFGKPKRKTGKEIMAQLRLWTEARGGTVRTIKKGGE